MEQKLVSIVLPTFNGERFIKDSIDSVINQTYQNWELIIVNDCSKDNTLEIVNEYANKDNRIKIINNETNLKLPASLNVGFRHAKGDYYTWTSDDNMFKPEAISKMVEYLNNKSECDFVSFNFDFINEEKEFLRQAYKNDFERNILQLTTGNNIGACFMYRKEIAKKVGEYDVNTFCAEDYEYWIRIALAGNICYEYENLYQYRENTQSLTATKKDIILEKTLEIRLKYANAIMARYGFSKEEQALELLKFYEQKYIKEWLKLARKTDFGVYWKYTMSKVKNKIKVKTKDLIKNIFSVRNLDEQRKQIRILFVKFNLKRKRKKMDSINYLEKYNLAKAWIEKYTVNNNGIAVESNQPNTIYPEVTGYYIPTLLKFGDKKRALNYANYLLSIQNEDGSWNEPSGKTPYTFDTGMILKGLSALVEAGLDEDDKFKNSLIKGADYILSMQREDGSIATADYGSWGLPYGKRVPEAIHVYCLEAIRYVSKITNDEKYENCVKKALDFYLAQVDLTDFTTLSHFNAYIIEGLIDIGQIERAQRAMDLISLHQREDGSVSAYSHVDFVCSTGLLQYAICWYKLGEIDKANKAFDYVCKLQNPSGGWYGSYSVARDEANYFPTREIAWAVKYFLDAIYYGQKAVYNDIAHIFLDEIKEDDGRYQFIKNELKNSNYKDILDLGCGKARYTKRLVNEFQDKNFNCVDLSLNVLNTFDLNITKKEGSILNIPYKNDSFDFVFVCEALEHAIDIKNAIDEITRVLRKNGKAIIIDKDVRKLGQLQLAPFEQWFSVKSFDDFAKKNDCKCRVVENISYEDRADGLFNAWVIEK